MEKIIEIKDCNSTETHWGLLVTIEKFNFFGSKSVKTINVFKKKGFGLWTIFETGKTFKLNGWIHTATEVLDFFVSDTKNLN